MEETEEVQQKCDVFRYVYEKGVKKYVLMFKIDEDTRNDRFHIKCETAKQKRYQAWKEMGSS